MKLRHAAFGLATLLATSPLVACDPAPPEGDEAALGHYVYRNKCEPCHAADGSGNPANGAPTIFGLPDWYVVTQLEHFRDGQRGKHFDDIAGLRMRPMARTVSDEEIVAVAAHIAASPPVRLATDRPVEGDVEKGKAAFALCAACHGQNGEGNKATFGPPLAGMDDWYVLTQLQNFKSGVRGADPEDVNGATMRTNALTMSDEDMRDVVAYINTLSR